MRIIGLTGGIGSGKSTVSQMLRELGATVIDADEAVHAIEQPGQPALAEIRATFGPAVMSPDGSLDRDALAERVFKDEGARKTLEAITHPRVGEWMAERVASAAAAGIDTVVMDIPLLFENGLEAGMAETIVVWCPLQTQVKRAVRRGLKAPQVRARIAAQISLDEKRRRATRVIDNSGSLAQTRRQVERVWTALTSPSNGTGKSS